MEQFHGYLHILGKMLTLLKGTTITTFLKFQNISNLILLEPFPNFCCLSLEIQPNQICITYKHSNLHTSMSTS